MSGLKLGISAVHKCESWKVFQCFHSDEVMSSTLHACILLLMPLVVALWSIHSNNVNQNLLCWTEWWLVLVVDMISEKFVLNGRSRFICALREVLLEKDLEECGIRWGCYSLLLFIVLMQATEWTLFCCNNLLYSAALLSNWAVQI